MKHHANDVLDLGFVAMLDDWRFESEGKVATFGRCVVEMPGDYLLPFAAIYFDGRQGLAEIRQREALAAADLIGAEFHPSLVNDLEIFYDLPTLSRLAAVMREVAPEILLIHAPLDYMEDHMNACRLALTAAFARGMPNFQTVPPRPPVDHTVTVYHAQPHGNRDPLGAPVRPSLYVDVSGVMQEKAAMLACHKSQQQWLDTSQGLNAYLETMRELMREVGGWSGRYEYAEGWRRHLHLGFCGPDDDPLVNALETFALKAERAAEV